jgi:hypothetical protein
MPDAPSPDELDDYLRGGSELSCQYQRESAPVPPHELDRGALESAGSFRSTRPFKSRRLAPFALAASMLLSLALVTAMVFGPRVNKTDDKPQVLQVRIFKSESPRAAIGSPRERNPTLWLEDINALRRAGRGNEAELQMRRFRSAYPDYIIPVSQ